MILLGTGFLPVLGLNFEWVTIHWVVGLVVLALVIVHVVRRAKFNLLKQMWIGAQDLVLTWQAIRTGQARTGKYSLAQKLMHHGVTVLVVITLITGILMMIRIDTPLWERNIYLFEDTTWGIIYALHGFAAMALLTTVMLHIYFGLRPEKMLYTRSMLRGWISKEEYQQHHDPALWPTAAEHQKENSNRV